MQLSLVLSVEANIYPRKLDSASVPDDPSGAKRCLAYFPHVLTKSGLRV